MVNVHAISSFEGNQMLFLARAMLGELKPKGPKGKSNMSRNVLTRCPWTVMAGVAKVRSLPPRRSFQRSDRLSGWVTVPTWVVVLNSPLQFKSV